MKSLRCFAIGLLFFLPLTAHAGHHEGLMEEVAANNNALAKAMVAGDVDTMLGFYVEDAISLPNQGPRMDGVETFKQYHAQMAAAGVKIRAFDAEPTDVWQAGDQVIEIGKFEITLEMAGMSAPIEDRGKYMTVYVRDADGKLKIKVETWNTDINPMEMMGNDGHDDGHGH